MDSFMIMGIAVEFSDETLDRLYLVATKLQFLNCKFVFYCSNTNK